MITTMLQGGLGNQLFQYAFGLAQAERLGTELIIDATLLQRDSQRQYNLDLFKGVTETLRLGSKATVTEEGMDYASYDIVDGDVLRGYWQCEKYFDRVVSKLFEKIIPAQPFPQLFFPHAFQQIKKYGSRSTFLQVRRGDYVAKQDFHGVLPLDYYEKAIQTVREKANTEPVIFVFSDEPDWCKENLKLSAPFEVLGSYNQTNATTKGREDADLFLMSLCHHAIIANSSFGWWGAWLGDFDGRRERVVIGPEQWFTDERVDSSTIMPRRWIRL